MYLVVSSFMVNICYFRAKRDGVYVYSRKERSCINLESRDDFRLADRNQIIFTAVSIHLSCFCYGSFNSFMLPLFSAEIISVFMLS